MTQQQLHPDGAPPRPGNMTAVMRALVADGPKVLRVGLVTVGRIRQEQIIEPHADVTVGPSEKSMFVLGARNLPGVFKLFQWVDGRYCLNVLDGFRGRLALGGRVRDLDTLKREARRRPDGSYQIELSDDARGRVAIGDVAVLFQFVTRPRKAPRPQLPAAAMRGASGIDWPTTVIASFSFLLHFVAIAALYSDWLDPVVDEEYQVAGLVETVKSLPAPPPLEQAEPAESKKDEGTQEQAAKRVARANKSSRQANKPAGALSQAQAAALSRDLESLELATLGGLVGQGPATAGVLDSSSLAPGLLDEAAASAAGVSGESLGGLKLGDGGGTIRPGAAGGGLATIGTTGKGKGTAETVGTEQKVQGPKGSANVGGAAVAGGSVSNADSVVARMRAGFRACYNRELQSNPDAQGRIMLTIKIGPGGEVQSVTASPTGNLGSAVACVRARAAAAQFAPPEGGTVSVIQVPVTFVKQ